GIAAVEWRVATADQHVDLAHHGHGKPDPKRKITLFEGHPKKGSAHTHVSLTVQAAGTAWRKRPYRGLRFLRRREQWKNTTSSPRTALTTLKPALYWPGKTKAPLPRDGSRGFRTTGDRLPGSRGWRLQWYRGLRSPPNPSED